MGCGDACGWCWVAVAVGWCWVVVAIRSKRGGTSSLRTGLALSLLLSSSAHPFHLSYFDSKMFFNVYVLVICGYGN